MLEKHVGQILGEVQTAWARLDDVQAAVDQVFGSIGADAVEFYAVLDDFIQAVDVDQFGPARDRLVWRAGAFGGVNFWRT